MKKNGKSICKQLKEIRRRVADENDIPLEQKECTYQGACDGTCPSCEAEVRYLENELQSRKKLGKAAMFSGMAISLASLFGCTPTGDVPVRGKIAEPLEGDVMVDPDTTSGATQPDSNSNQQTIQYQ